MATTKTIKSVIAAAILATTMAHASDMHQVFQCDLDDHQQVTAYAQNGVVWYGYVNYQTHQSWEYPNDDQLDDNKLLTVYNLTMRSGALPYVESELWFKFNDGSKVGYAILESGYNLKDGRQTGSYTMVIDGQQTYTAQCVNSNIGADAMAQDIQTHYFAKGYNVSKDSATNTFNLPM